MIKINAEYGKNISFLIKTVVFQINGTKGLS